MIAHDFTEDTSVNTILTDEFPAVRSILYPFNFGTFAWKIPDLGVRYLKKSTAVHIKDNWYEPPTAITRKYLDDKFPNRMRASNNQRLELNHWISSPLMVKPGFYKDMVYLDLKAAYWSIVKRFGWNVDYFPGKWLLRGNDCRDFPLPDNKIARNCLVSFGLPTTARRWTGQNFTQFKSKNAHINLCLWRLVQDILHSIANVASEHGGVYCHTDGYILPRKHSHSVQNYLEEFGLTCSIKAEGEAIVMGFGNYIIGDRYTKRLLPVLQEPYKHIYSRTDTYMNIVIKAGNNSSYI